jgi:hypothetical protein
VSFSQQQVALLQHALGIQKRGEKWTAPHRNYFDAADKDVPDWEELVRLGLASKIGTHVDFPGVWFRVTDAGRAVAIAQAIYAGAKFPKTSWKA